MSQRNEHIRLFATYLNSVASGIFGAGIIGPAAVLVLGNPLHPERGFTFFLLCFVLSIDLHGVAHAVTSELEP